MLRLENLCVSYENNIAVKNVSVDFADHRIYAVLGKSGSGKTTLAKAIASILPFEGRILFQGQDLDRHKHRIALVPQNHGLIPWKTVEENITLPLKIRNTYDPRALEEISKELGIHSLMKKYPNHISGGERQRVSMARAFLSDPHILLLDEAFSALDAITKDEAHEVFFKAFHHHKVTTLLITHDVEEALCLAETILIFKDGTISKSIENPLASKGIEADAAAFLSLRKEVKALL